MTWFLYCVPNYWVHNDKVGSNGLEMSQLGTQYKNQVIWSWKESIGYTMIFLTELLAAGNFLFVFCVHNRKIRSIWSSKELIGYTMIKWITLVGKGLSCISKENVCIFTGNACIFLHFPENVCIFIKMHKIKFSEVGLVSSKGLLFERPN